MVEHASDVLAVVEADGRVRYVSPSVERMLGYRPENLVGRGPFERTHPDDLDSVLKSFAEARETPGIKLPVRCRVQAADGSWRHLEIVRNNLLNDPDIRGFVVSSRDVTDRVRAEERIRFQVSLLDAVGQAVIAVDLHERIEYWNRAAEEMYGWSAGEAVGKPLREVLLLEDELPRADAIMSELRAGKSWSGELMVRRRDGTRFPVVVTDTPVLDERSNVIGIIGVSTDVTERREFEEALRANEERYRSQSRELALLHQASTALAHELELSAVFRTVVEAIAETYGYTLVSAYLLKGDELVLQHQVGYHQVIERIPVTQGVTGRTVRTGRPELLEEAHTDPDFLSAIEGITSEICVPLFDGGEVVGIFNVESTSGAKLTQDDLKSMVAVGEQASVAVGRARLHARVRESEERFRALTQNSSDIVTLMGADGTIRYQSPSIERILGYRPEELVGKNAFYYIHPEDLGRVEMAFVEGLEDPGRRPSAEYRFRHRDGRWVWLESVGNNLLDDPRVGEYVINTRDITARKRAEKALKESEQRFKNSFRDAAIGMALVGTDGRFLQVNRSLCEILGYPEAKLLFKTFQDITHPEDLRTDLDHMPRLLAGEILTYQMEKRYIHKEGHTVWALLSVSMVRDEGDEPLYFVSQIQDISERKRAEEALREAEKRYRTLVEQIPAVTYIDPVDDPDTSLYTSPQIEEMLGYTPEEWTNEKLWPKRLHPDDRERVLAADERFESGDGEPFSEEYRLLAKDGSVVWVREEAVLVRDEEGKPRFWQGIIRDITERREAEERLEYQALHDSLTDLPNRRLFVDRLGQALRRTRRRGNRVAVLFIDLNGFKVVNDSLGHEAGDLLLSVVAARLRRRVRPEDTLARFGGDEFVVLMPDVGSPDEAFRVAQRLADEFRRPFLIEARELFVTVSIGIAFGTARTTSPEVLLRDADIAMYRAKEEGAGYRMFEPEMHERAVKRLETENDLRRAVEAREFVVHYQPIFDLRTGATWGVEALLRWDHPRRGLLEPLEFMPALEETGLVVPVGERVLEEACRQARAWHDDPRIPLPVVSVNLSAEQVRRSDLARSVEEALRKTGLEASSLSLDITESAYISVLEDKTAALERLKKVGVGISIDDFGVGYSSLSYLKRLPADMLKVDRSFVRGLGEDIEDTAIVRMVIELAHVLGMEVVAEGVESADQLEQLKEMGCDLAQGFYFAEARSGGETSALLSSGSL